MSLSDELENLAGELDPACKRPRFRMVTDPKSEEVDGTSAPNATDEVIRFTLHIDRRHDDEPA